jgi:hypothetical protein
LVARSAEESIKVIKFLLGLQIFEKNIELQTVAETSEKLMIVEVKQG